MHNITHLNMPNITLSGYVEVCQLIKLSVDSTKFLLTKNCANPVMITFKLHQYSFFITLSQKKYFSET